MNFSGWDWVTIAGGTLQIAGVGLLVIDVRASFRRLADYRHRPTTVYVGAGLAVGSVPRPTVTTGQQSTLEERLSRLEGDVGSLRDDLDQTRARLMHDARAVAEDAADRASKGADDRFTAMERALLGETPWDTRRRLVGIGLVVLGVALATVAAVAS